jgi:hypothetical protein
MIQETVLFMFYHDTYFLIIFLDAKSLRKKLRSFYKPYYIALRH